MANSEDLWIQILRKKSGFLMANDGVIEALSLAKLNSFK
tara:strand:- start:379 stop:495 length:117 start_codon:yes stop_codon:yes gene_type:complete